MGRIGGLAATTTAVFALAMAATGAAADGLAPVLSSEPTISGPSVAGQMLAATTGSWKSRGSVKTTLKWLRCGSNGADCASIANATLSTFSPTSSEVGATLRVQVTASNRWASTVATSAPTPAIASPSVAPTRPTNAAPPTIAGTAQENQRLTTSPGSWSGTTPIAYAYQWFRCDAQGYVCEAIFGATGTAYTLGAADVGKRNKVAVTASNGAGASTSDSPLATVVTSGAGIGPTTDAPPSISGETQVGVVLTASPGSWSGSQPIGYSYTWQRCDPLGGACTAIPGSSAQTLQLTTDDLARTMRVRVTASNGAGSSAATSLQTAPVTAAPPGAAPYFVGDFEAGSLSPWEHVWPDAACSQVTTSSGQGAHAARLSVGPSYPTTRADANSEKCELWLESHQDSGHSLNGKAFGYSGSETWDRHLIYLPTNFVASPGEWNWFLQWHNDSGYYDFTIPGGWEEVNLAIGIYHYSGRTDRWFLRTYGGKSSAPGYGSTKFEALGPAVELGRWVEFVQHVVWSPDPSQGLVEWWVNGQLIASRHTPTLYVRPDGSVSYVNYQLGYYRYNPSSLGLPDASILVDAAKVGPTRDSVK